MVIEPLSILGAATGVFVLTGIAEWIHSSRIRHLGRLAFGPKGRPRFFARCAGPLRAGSMAALTWGLLYLSGQQTAPVSNDPIDVPIRHHLILAIDVSPSMYLTDGGKDRSVTRKVRAGELLRSLLDRLDMNETRVSVVAFYTEAKPVVVDTHDPEVVKNIVNDLPMEHAFKPGKTNLYAGVEEAYKLAKAWPPGTATLLVVSDGDTLPGSGLPARPSSIGNVLVLGVGAVQKGLFIDGHSSRQNRDALNRLALRLGGMYHNGNEKHVPTTVLANLSHSIPALDEPGLSKRDLALVLSAVGGSILALLSPLLFGVGSPSRRRS